MELYSCYHLTVRLMSPDWAKGRGWAGTSLAPGTAQRWQNQTGGAAPATTFSQKQPNLGGSWELLPGVGDSKWEPHMLQSLHPTLGHRSLAHCTFTRNPILLDAWPRFSESPCRSQARCMGLGLWPKSWAGEGLPRPESESCMLMVQMCSLLERLKGLGPWHRFLEQTPEAQFQSHSHLQLKGELCGEKQANK